MNKKPRVTICVTGDDRHQPYLLEGLVALQERGEISLAVRPRAPRFRDRIRVSGNELCRVSRPYPYSYRLHLHDAHSGAVVRAAVDLQDWKGFFSHGDLASCDVLFKRSYDPLIAQRISRTFGITVLPAGMTHSGKVENGRFNLPLALARLLGKLESFLTNPQRAPGWLRAALTGRGRTTRNGRSPATASILPEDLKEFVFFQIQCHGDGGWREAEELNRARAALIRSLRTSLGRQFQGGMYFEGPVRPEFADCLSNLPSSPNEYLQLVARASVVISTNGFGGSFPWKLCEYLSLGKCILTESLAFPLPAPIVPGKEADFFENYADCAAKAARLLNDPVARYRMGRAAREYYANHVAPVAAARRFVQTALEIARN